MADEYTPTTKNVLLHYAAAGGDLIPEREAEFDRWLAAYEAEVRERIVQDIAEAAVDDGMSSDWRYGMRVAAGIARGATR